MRLVYRGMGWHAWREVSLLTQHFSHLQSVLMPLDNGHDTDVKQCSPMFARMGCLDGGLRWHGLH